jgi:flagellar motor switch protein FliN/FliY
LAQNERRHDNAAWLSEKWIAKLAGSIEMMTEARPGVKGEPCVQPLEAPRQAFWISIPLNLAAGGAIFVGATEENWLPIGQSALLAAGVKTITAADARSAFVEMISQATSGLAQALTERLERPVASFAATEAGFDETVRPSAAALTPVEISLGEDQASTRIYLGWSRPVELELAGPSVSETQQVDGVSSSVAFGRLAAGKSTTFDLLMEVELPVSVSFGRADLPLRDVLKLNSGSIVELNRTITDQVEIIVNNCVIARGEVVVVEGNYGVRIQEVISREERLRTLK